MAAEWLCSLRKKSQESIEAECRADTRRRRRTHEPCTHRQVSGGKKGTVSVVMSSKNRWSFKKKKKIEEERKKEQKCLWSQEDTDKAKGEKRTLKRNNQHSQSELSPKKVMRKKQYL